MKRGRPPKPTRLRLLSGNAGKRPIKKDEPKPPVLTNLRPPSWLDRFGKEFWRRHAPELARQGLLTKLDRDHLALGAERWSTYRRAIAELKETMTQTTEANGRITKPEVAIAKQAVSDLRGILSSFGCSPSDRTKVTVVQPLEKDEFEKFLSNEHYFNR